MRKDNSIKIGVEVNTDELDIALNKANELKELLEGMSFKEINYIGENIKTLLFFCDYRLKSEDTERIEKVLSAKIGKKCVVIDSILSKMIGIE